MKVNPGSLKNRKKFIEFSGWANSVARRRSFDRLGMTLLGTLQISHKSSQASVFLSQFLTLKLRLNSLESLAAEGESRNDGAP
jgi:hypothetical protein